MFKNISLHQAELIYLGLKSLIETKSKHGLVNGDGGHPAYLAGMNNEDHSSHDFGDSPDKNPLYKMLHELSNKLKKEGIESHHYKWWYDFKDWKSFCEFVVHSYKN